MAVPGLAIPVCIHFLTANTSRTRRNSRLIASQLLLHTNQPNTMRNLHAFVFVLALLFQEISLVECQSMDVKPFPASPSGTVSGVTKRWHRVTIGFRGPNTKEQAKRNPFTNYRLDVTFVHQITGRNYKVPGYYAADGNAANTGATAGNVWLVHFAPDLIGEWNWSASFVTGPNIATRQGGSSAGFFHGRSGRLVIQETDKTGGRDHRGKGRLNYVGSHHLQFSNGEWFLKGGVDSPENFLAYDEFDNTPNQKYRRKSWAPHLRDSRTKDPTWRGGRGKSIMGALNYLALEKRMNAFSFMTMNIAGDDKNVFPYISSNSSDFYRIDVSKVAQWEVLFSHADRLGLFMHFKTQETENDQLLDGGGLGLQRKFYYRELIARFSHHLALNWNLGEENTNTRTQQLNFAKHFKKLDPYKHPVVIHTKPDPMSKEKIFGGLLGSQYYDGISIQASRTDIFNDTIRWVHESSNTRRPWVVANDEQAGAGVGIQPDNTPDDPNHDDARHKVLWANLLAGGAGCEYYFGFRFPENDMTLQNFRSRDQFFTQTRHALDFFRNHKIPFWDMENIKLRLHPDLFCLTDKKRSIFVIYLPNSSSPTKIDITGGPKTLYSIHWFNPRQGGSLTRGTKLTLELGEGKSIGNPPAELGGSIKDSVALIRRVRGTQRAS